MIARGELPCVKDNVEAWFNALRSKGTHSPSGSSEPDALPNRSASKPTFSNTLIIFDWDDTLLCSHALQHDPAVMADATGLASLGKEVQALLRLSSSLGALAIVTNSREGWVHSSAEAYLPMLLPSLKGVPVIYAKEEFSKDFSSSLQWKFQTFLELQRCNADTITNVVVVGDSSDEIIAARMLGMIWPHVLVKQVKLVSKPSLVELKQQLRFVRGKLQRLVESDQSERIAISQ
mmetsp:Transcript_9294/g.20678  ORF Transcript_9294/g.20678 Transcript_9294/m.20678 type:complete len:234 (-) Transcript_9294:210-911(-)|eukprot:CAMPEP_0170615342 /NCGR_PEP_ID=MMETSP0224-20130122/25284_1 /TAXON_ID=285029 /ORGANISM="Togula jolla, Strain CCCM 725" /LENGTH=233 /DNA_ID=CAMNT_0010941063 /DNA_START=14 /DNA_END=715 /DNA_ORIENTATION=-